jgi:hypothetical protein
MQYARTPMSSLNIIVIMIDKVPSKHQLTGMRNVYFNVAKLLRIGFIV